MRLTDRYNAGVLDNPPQKAGMLKTLLHRRRDIKVKVLSYRPLF